MISSPKQRFLTTPESKPHFDLVANGAFHRAVDASLLQMLYESKLTPDPTEAVAGYNRLTGAMEFVRILLTIADKPREGAKVSDVNLNFRA